MGNGFEFSPLSIPFGVLAVLLIAVMLTATLTRGDRLIRIGLLFVCLSATPYFAGMGLMLSATDPELARRCGVVFVGAIALLGPSIMFLLFAMSGRLERYRWLLVVAWVCAISMSVLTWTTELVVAPEVRWVSTGFYFHQARALEPLVVLQFVGWAVVGLWLSRSGIQGPASQRQRRLRTRIGGIIALSVAGASDSLLSNGHGIYPFGVFAAICAVSLLLVALARFDLLHSRGFDRGAAIELLIAVVAIGLVAAGLWSLSSSGAVEEPALIVILFVPLLGLARGAMWLARSQTPRSVAEQRPAAELAVEALVEQCARIESEEEILEPLAHLLSQHTSLAEVRLYTADARGVFVVVGSTGEGHKSRASALEPIDHRVRAWLVANPVPLLLDNLATMRLGGLREPIGQFIHNMNAGVVVPLVDRDVLVGLLTAATSGRALRESEVDLLSDAARAAAKALTYASLFREAAARSEVAKEVEVATAVQHARAAGEQKLDYDGWRVTGYYQPAETFGGHWWASYRLADDRFSIVMGDVSGAGVSAALISFTAEGACETAHRMYGASLEVLSLLEVLNCAVRDVGDTQSMACFAAIFDPSANRITFANAGHPFPYVCRKVAGQEAPKLRSLVSRGTPLGGPELVVSAATFELEPDDVIVFHSDSLVDGRNTMGKAYGERRLQRVLTGRAARSPGCEATAILDDAMAYRGGRPLEDDLNLVVVRASASS